VTGPDPALHQIGATTYAYVQPDGGWCVNNAGFVHDGGTGLLVDTVATRRRNEALAAAVAAVHPDGPDYLVNTHFHGDHTFGNALFAPRARIIAHRACRDDQVEAGLGLCSLWPDVDWGDPEVRAADVTFSGELGVRVGDVDVRLRHPGPAHTPGDTVVWVPGDRVLFAGDIVWSATTPFCLMGSVAGSLVAIETLRGLGPAVVVPGHGPVGGPELLDETARYLGWVLELARDGLRRGRSALETARGADLGAFAQLGDPERLVGNLHRAEMTGTAPGERIDVAAAFTEMVELHGGLPVCRA
jgi:cyclase